MAFLTDRASPRFTRFFSWWVTEKMIAKKFFAVRVSRESDLDGVRALADHPGPVIAVINHASWWDPLVMLMLQRLLLGNRTLRAPMDITQLRKFKFFQRLGAFGIDPDDPESMRAMQAHVFAYFERCAAQQERGTLWVTPQGRFADVRTPLVVRPGAAAIAARLGGARVIAVNAEYGFWIDQKPELFLHMSPVGVPSSRDGGPPSTSLWHRAITASMRSGQAALAERVIARDPAGFETLIGGESASMHPFYDWIVRLRGQRAAITVHDRKGPVGVPAPSEGRA